jgi:hypothetical protein
MHIHAPSGRANSTSVSVGEVVGHGIDGVMSTNAGDVSAPALAEVACRAIRCFLRSVGLNRRRFATRPLDKTVLKATACFQRSSGMRACPLRRARRQRSKRLANSVKAASAGVSIGVDIGSISQIDHEMKVYLRSTTFQMSRTLTGSTQLLKERASACCVEMFTKLKFSERRVAASINGFILRILAIA